MTNIDQNKFPKRGGRRRWAAVLAITAVAVGGGAFAAAEAATSSPAAPATLTAAGTSASASTQASASTATRKVSRFGRVARLRALGGLYGQFTVETKTGVRTLAFERGTITSVSGNDVVIRAHNGMTEAWTLTSKSVVREGGKRTRDSALSTGELVFAGGPVSGGAHDIRLIVIRKASSSSSQPTT